MKLLAALALLVAFVVAVEVHAARAAGRPWNRAFVTGYSTRENLTGCRTTSGRRACWTACGHPWATLDDRAFTVASNPALGLRCGTRLIFCGHGCHVATVTDRTASHFDFEFSYALAVATGAPRSYPGFASPRYVRWRRA